MKLQTLLLKNIGERKRLSSPPSPEARNIPGAMVQTLPTLPSPYGQKLAPLFVRPVRLPFLTAAFGRPAAPAFCRRAAWHRQRLLPRNRPPPQRVPPGPLPPDTARPGVPPRQAAAYPRGCAARRRASRCAAGALCLPLHKLVINGLKFLQTTFKWLSKLSCILET